MSHGTLLKYKVPSPVTVWKAVNLRSPTTSSARPAFKTTEHYSLCLLYDITYNLALAHYRNDFLYFRRVLLFKELTRVSMYDRRHLVHHLLRYERRYISCQRISCLFARLSSLARICDFSSMFEIFAANFQDFIFGPARLSFDVTIKMST